MGGRNAGKRRRVVATAGLFAIAASAAACQLISGVDDFTFGGDGGSEPGQDGEATTDGATAYDATVPTDAPADVGIDATTDGPGTDAEEPDANLDATMMQQDASSDAPDAMDAPTTDAEMDSGADAAWRWSFYELDASLTSTIRITSGPEGKLWFTAQSSNSIGSIALDGSVASFPLQSIGDFGPIGITAGPDGALWMTGNSNEIVRLDTDGGVKAFPISGSSGNITLGPDNALWFTEYQGNMIGRLPIDGGAITYASAPKGAVDISVGPDGNIWVTTLGTYLYNVSISAPTTANPFQVTANETANITSGPRGALWFTDLRNGVDRTPPIGGATTTVISQPGNTFLGIATVGSPPNTVWVVSSAVGTPPLYRIDADGGVMATDSIPLSNFSLSGALAVGPDGAIWLTGQVGSSDCIARYQPPP